MNAGKSYAAGLEIGDCMLGEAVGEVVESKHARFAVGDWVAGYFGWQEWALTDGAAHRARVVDAVGTPPQAYLGACGGGGGARADAAAMRGSIARHAYPTSRPISNIAHARTHTHTYTYTHTHTCKPCTHANKHTHTHTSAHIHIIPHAHTTHTHTHGVYDPCRRARHARRDGAPWPVRVR